MRLAFDSRLPFSPYTDTDLCLSINWSKCPTQHKTSYRKTCIKSKTVFGLSTIFLMITSRLDKSKHFELVFSQIGGLEPDLWILEDLDIFWWVCCFFIDFFYRLTIYPNRGSNTEHSNSEQFKVRISNGQPFFFFFSWLV